MKKPLRVFWLLFAIALCSSTLVRCGSAFGPTYKAAANAMKF